MYAVIVSGGKQYRVSPGTTVKLDTLDANSGDTVTFEKVLFVSDGDNLKIGSPYLENAKVLASVVGHGRAKKINVLKFKRRKNYLKRQGHRQNYTEVKITDIQAAS